MILVRVSDAQRQRAEFWAGLSSRILTFMHPAVLHAGESLDLELRLLDDRPPLYFGGVVVSCEKRRVENRDLFRVNFLIDRIADAVAQELNRHIAAHANAPRPAAPAGADVEAATPMERRPPNATPPPASMRSVVETLAAERARLAEARHEVASLKEYAQTLENQLLDSRLTPRGVGPFGEDPTPAYGSLAPSLPLARSAEAEAAQKRSQAETTEKLRAAAQMLVAANAAAAAAQRETGERQKALEALEAKLAAASEAAAAAQREAAERQKALEEKLVSAGEAAAAPQAEAAERQKALEENLAAAGERQKALEENLAAAAERQKALEENLAAANDRQKGLEEKLAAAGEAAAAPQQEAGDLQKALEEKLAVAATALRDADERQKALEEKVVAAEGAAATAQREAGERQKALEQKLAAAGESASTAQREADERQKALEERLASASEAAQRAGSEHQEALEARLAAAGEASAKLEAQLAAATAGLLAAEQESTRAQKELAELRTRAESAPAIEGELAKLKEAAAETEARLTAKVSEAEARVVVVELGEKVAVDKVSAVELRLSVAESAAAVAVEEAAAQRKALEEQLAQSQQAVEAERIKVSAETARANAGQAAFAVLEERVRKLDETQVEQVRRIATLEGDAGTQRTATEEEVKAVREAALAAKEVADARQRTLEEELAGLVGRFSGQAPEALVSAVVPPSVELEVRVRAADDRIAELTRERDGLQARKVELEKDVAQKARAVEARKPAGFALQNFEEEEPEGASPLVRWLVSFAVAGGIAAAVVAWLTRAH